MKAMTSRVLRAGARFASSGPEQKGTPITDIKYNGMNTFTQVQLGGHGTNIASEEPIFGNYGYKPLPLPTKDHYNLSDPTLSRVYTTSTKGMRDPDKHRKVLPKPAKVVTLFGATGYAATRIAKELVLADEIEEVRLCTRYPDHIPADLQKVIELNPDKCTVEEVNLQVHDTIHRAMVGADHAVFAVDMRHDDFYNLHHDVYVQGMQNVTLHARFTGVKRIIDVSGLDAIHNSDSDYSDARFRTGDAMMSDCFFGTVIRVGKLYGGGMRRTTNFSKQFYPCVYPDTKLQPVWVNDLAVAVRRVLAMPESSRRVIELGGPTVKTHMEFASDVALNFNGPKPFPVPWRAVWPLAWMNQFVHPRPLLCTDWINEMELDQVARNQEENPHIWTWENLGMRPSTIEEASALEKEGKGF